jgi:hypothetical protein
MDSVQTETVTDCHPEWSGKLCFCQLQQQLAADNSFIGESLLKVLRRFNNLPMRVQIFF